MRVRNRNKIQLYVVGLDQLFDVPCSCVYLLQKETAAAAAAAAAGAAAAAVRSSHGWKCVCFLGSHEPDRLFCELFGIFSDPRGRYRTSFDHKKRALKVRVNFK